MKRLMLLLIALVLMVPALNAQVNAGPPLPGHMAFPPPAMEKAGSNAGTTGFPPPSTLSVDPAVLDLINQLDQALVLDYLTDLVAFGPRVTGTPACDQAGDYIHGEFTKMGLDTQFHYWSYYGYSGKNVVATLHPGGASNDVFVVCGHYDSVSGSPGADDNGSGTAAVLAIADILSEYIFDVEIRFVAFDGEEQGLLGSHVYAEDISNNGDNVVACLNADMIGFAISSSDEKQIKVYHDTQSNWLVSYVDNVAYDYRNYIDLDVIPSGYSWGSDHSSFWDVGYSAVFYHEYKFNSYYHSSQDTINNMNLAYYVKCCKLVLASLGELAGPYEPVELKADGYTLSARDGGIVNFSLDGQPAKAYRDYVLLASVTGTDPGTPLPGGVTLPLNWDVLTKVVVQNLNTPAFMDFMGVLDGNGQGTAQLNTLGALPPQTVGIELFFAFACYGPWDHASHPIAIEIVD